MNKSAAVYSGQGGCTDFCSMLHLRKSQRADRLPKAPRGLFARLDVSPLARQTVKLCCADQLPLLSTTNILYRMMVVPSKSGTFM